MKCQFCRLNEADLTFEDPETIQEVWICKSCMLKVYPDDCNCEANNCGDPAVDTDEGNDFVCKEHNK